MTDDADATGLTKTYRGHRTGVDGENDGRNIDFRRLRMLRLSEKVIEILV